MPVRRGHLSGLDTAAPDLDHDFFRPHVGEALSAQGGLRPLDGDAVAGEPARRWQECRSGCAPPPPPRALPPTARSRSPSAALRTSGGKAAGSEEAAKRRVRPRQPAASRRAVHAWGISRAHGRGAILQLGAASPVTAVAAIKSSVMATERTEKPAASRELAAEFGDNALRLRAAGAVPRGPQRGR